MSKILMKSSLIEKGKTEGTYVYFEGSLRFVGIPAGMTSSMLILKGSFDGQRFFSINSTMGPPLTFRTKNYQTADPVTGIIPPQVIPLPDPGLADGILMLVPISTQPEQEDRVIEFYYKAAL